MFNKKLMKLFKSSIERFEIGRAQIENFGPK